MCGQFVQVKARFQKTGRVHDEELSELRGVEWLMSFDVVILPMGGNAGNEIYDVLKP